MTIIRVDHDVDFAPKPNSVSLVLSSERPPDRVITSAFGFVFSEGRLLMTRIRERGWDIPGGHLRSGETAEQAMCREVLEETGMIVKPVRQFGYQHIRIEGEVPDNYRYPTPDGYQVFFVAQLLRDDGFRPTEEAAGWRYFPLDEVRALEWTARNPELFHTEV